VKPLALINVSKAGIPAVTGTKKRPDCMLALHVGDLDGSDALAKLNELLEETMDQRPEACGQLWTRCDAQDVLRNVPGLCVVIKAEDHGNIWQRAESLLPRLLEADNG